MSREAVLAGDTAMAFPDGVFQSFLGHFSPPAVVGRAAEPDQGQTHLPPGTRRYWCALIVADSQALSLCCGSIMAG